jgi:hypothetical protein
MKEIGELEAENLRLKAAVGLSHSAEAEETGSKNVELDEQGQLDLRRKCPFFGSFFRRKRRLVVFVLYLVFIHLFM